MRRRDLLAAPGARAAALAAFRESAAAGIRAPTPCSGAWEKTNGRVEKAGSQNATFMLSNRDLGDGEIGFPRLMRALKRVQNKGLDRGGRSLRTTGPAPGLLPQHEIYSGKVSADLLLTWTPSKTATKLLRSRGAGILARHVGIRADVFLHRCAQRAFDK
jgi:hypothetical protein